MGQEGVGGPSQGLKSQAPAPLSRALSVSPSLALPTQHPEGCYDNHQYPVRSLHAFLIFKVAVFLFLSFVFIYLFWPCAILVR